MIWHLRAFSCAMLLLREKKKRPSAPLFHPLLMPMAWMNVEPALMGRQDRVMG